MSIEHHLDYSHQIELEHEQAVQQMFGPNVVHITNMYDADEVFKAQKVVDQVESAFTGVALIGDGTFPDSRATGLYTSNNDDVAEIWKMMEEDAG